MPLPRTCQSAFKFDQPLPMMPRFTIERVRQQLETSFPTATAAVKVLEELGVVTEITGQKKTGVSAIRPTLNLKTSVDRSFVGSTS
jgi:hypothetical protein